MATVEMREREKEFAKRSLESLKQKQTGPQNNFDNLFGAQGYFLKSQKNSYKLELTFRTTTEIGEVK